MLKQIFFSKETFFENWLVELTGELTSTLDDEDQSKVYLYEVLQTQNAQRIVNGVRGKNLKTVQCVSCNILNTLN